MTDEVGAIMPARPLRVSPRFWRRKLPPLVLMLSLTALCFAVAAYSAADAQSIIHDQQLWRDGEPGREVSVRGGNRKVRWGSHTHELTARYRDAHGNLYEGEQIFGTVLAFRASERVELRYDPAAPERFTLNWAVERSGARWRRVVIEVVVFGLLGLVPLVFARHLRRTIRNVRRAARSSDELLVEFTSSFAESSDRHERSYRFRTPERYVQQLRFAHLADVIFEEIIDDREALPLLGYRKGERGVALCPAWGQPVLVHDNFYPFALSEAQADLVDARIAELREHVD